MAYRFNLRVRLAALVVLLPVLAGLLYYGFVWIPKEVERLKSNQDVPGLIAAAKGRYPDSLMSSLAIRALGDLRDPRAVEPLLGVLGNASGNSDVRSEAALALGKLNDPRIIPALKQAVKDSDPVVRRNAGDALARIDPVARQELVSALVDPESNLEAAQALARINWLPPSDADRVHFLVALRDKEGLSREWAIAKGLLVADLESGDERTAQNAMTALVRMGDESLVTRMTGALNRSGSKSLAELYLNSGHPELVKAAHEWAKSRGYEIKSMTGRSSASWGR